MTAGEKKEYWRWQESCWIDEAQGKTPLALRPPLPTTASLERWARPEAAGSGLSLVSFAARGTAASTATGRCPA